jgi:CO2 hydration protein (ChpXY)
MVSSKPYPYEDILRRLENADGLLPEDPINFLEVIGILESYGHVIQAYSINLRYIADTQFLVSVL